MRVHKRASKRVSTKQREKVKKKVREHKRKSKREAKNDPTWRTKKRQDPGIPNSFPYKDQLLDEIEQRRVAAEQQRLAEKEARAAGKAGLAVDEDGEESEEVGQEEMDVEEEEEEEELAAVAEQYDGSLKEFVEEYTGKGKQAKVTQVIFTLDARDPLSWRVPQLEGILQKQKVAIIYALTRADLVPREQVAAWIAHLSQQYHPTFAVSLQGEAQGVEGLAKKVKGTTIAVLGVENAGRSSLANALKSELPESIVFDTPALVPSASKQAHSGDMSEEDDEEEEEETEESLQARDRQAAHRVLIRNGGGIFKVHEPLPLIEALMRRTATSSDLMIAYTTPAFIDTNDFLIAVARASGRLRKGAVPDTTAAARTVLHQWSTGLTGYYAKAPMADTDASKKRVADARQAIEADKGLAEVILARKQWRERWQGKEVRLTTSCEGDSAMLDGAKVAFAAGQDDDDDEEDLEEGEDDDEEVDEDVDFDEEDEEEEEEEDDDEDGDDDDEEEE